MAIQDRIPALQCAASPEMEEAAREITADLMHFAEWAGRLHGTAQRD